jgi:hypothetical protein
MERQPRDQAPTDNGVGCGCLLIVILLAVLVGYRVFIYERTDEARSQAAPTSTTLAADEAAESGCYWWRNYLDGGPFFGKDELSARIAYAVGRAQESSVWAVAHAAKQYDQASTMQEIDAASDAFDRACEMVGE